ncbi:MAG: hypothetical protein Q7T41_00215, partial [Candidatus Saccharibacteria bacterium]|nr:hypothetical protein [Candidatus Saccharibacteria bacterium]
VKVKDQISSGTQICNASRMTASNSAASDSGQVCIGVINPCLYDSTKDANNPNCTEPKLTCALVDAAINRTTRNVTFKTTVTSTNPATTKVESYVYDFGDKTPVITRPASGFTDQTDHTFALGKYTTKVVVNYTATGVEGKQKVDCSAPITFEDSPLGQEKAVKNITQDKKLDTNIVNTVQSDNVLEYELITTNSQNYQRTGVDISDYIGDILDYAVLDAEFLKQQGGTFDESTKKVIWTNITVPANGKVLSYFRVKIKNPIPTTNSPSTVSGTFDCKIGNEYGNQITINIDCPLVKGVESLPNTGPGSSLAIMTGITFVVAYFFYRSRLLAREMDLIRNDYAATGGM